MLTFAQIKQMYEDDIGLSMDARKLAGWVYLAEIEIAKLYGAVTEKSYTSSNANTWYDLPLDHIATAEVRDSEGDYYQDYEIDTYGRVRFDDDGDYTMLYHKIPAMIDYTDENACPSCHGLFHASIVQFCLGKYWETSSEGSTGEVRMASNYYQEFHRQINETATILKRRVFRPRVIRKVRI